MSQKWGTSLIPCIAFCCIALCFNEGWILALVIAGIYLYSCIQGEMKNEQEKAYIKKQEEEYENYNKYRLKEHEKTLIIMNITDELINETQYVQTQCSNMAKSIVYRYCATYLIPYCTKIQNEMPTLSTNEIKELALQLIKEKYLEDVNSNQKVMFSPESPYHGDSELRYRQK